MTRKRLWEIGASAALMLAVGVIAAGFLRCRHLNNQLADALYRSDGAAIRLLLRKGASIHTHDEDGKTPLTHTPPGPDLTR
jgi:ankyrin repeat protein